MGKEVRQGLRHGKITSQTYVTVTRFQRWAAILFPSLGLRRPAPQAILKRSFAAENVPIDSADK